MLRRLHELLTKPWYVELREKIEARLDAGEWTEDTELSVALDKLRFDSLDWVGFEMAVEELSEVGFGPTARLETVGEFLWLLKAIEFRYERKSKL